MNIPFLKLSFLLSHLTPTHLICNVSSARQTPYHLSNMLNFKKTKKAAQASPSGYTGHLFMQTQSPAPAKLVEAKIPVVSAWTQSLTGKTHAASVAKARASAPPYPPLPSADSAKSIRTPRGQGSALPTEGAWKKSFSTNKVTADNAAAGATYSEKLTGPAKFGIIVLKRKGSADPGKAASSLSLTWPRGTESGAKAIGASKPGTSNATTALKVSKKGQLFFQNASN
ncbi:hypothetical protein P389DRAFT_168915 [Cystobasidium minutum MCA 4210]|uniref:uncharacterized protein n=1 Tax=Cystobasidium minutum MCA 4210 TaxID=1397322 RepID=UPI0034CD6D0E|eukprot:jgi/Rhomi1/168915/fgenesh1_kg.3_\